MEHLFLSQMNKQKKKKQLQLVLASHQAEKSIESIPDCGLSYIEQKPDDIKMKLNKDQFPCVLKIVSSLTLTLDEPNQDSCVFCMIDDCVDPKNDNRFFSIIFNGKNIGSYILADYSSITLLFCKKANQWFVT